MYWSRSEGGLVGGLPQPLWMGTKSDGTGQ